MMRFAATFSLMLLFLAVFGQEKRSIRTIDVITLINGDLLKGTIVSEDEKTYTILTEGVEYTISKSAVRETNKAIQTTRLREAEKIPHEFHVNQWVFSGQISMLAEEDHIGASVGIKSLYQISQYAGIGLGIALDQYRAPSSEKVVPVSLEYMGFINKEKIAPYYSLGVGYGFALKDENDGIVNANGGYMINPSIGVRIHSASSLSLDIYAGYKFQKAGFENRVFNWNGDGTVDRRYLFKRLHAGVGITF